MSKELQDRLQWLEEELLEEDWEDDGQDFDLDAILGEFSEEALPAQPENRAVEFARMAFGDEELDESTAVLVTRKKAKEAPAKGGRKGVGGLVFLAIVEVIAIIAVLLRWALWFL